MFASRSLGINERKKEEEADLIVPLLALGAAIARLIMRLTATASGRGRWAIRSHWMQKDHCTQVVGRLPQPAGRGRTYTAPWHSPLLVLTAVDVKGTSQVPLFTSQSQSRRILYGTIHPKRS